jgi:hypothetical protein
VIGVATAILRGGQNLNLGVPSQYVAELMAKPKPMSMNEFAARVTALQRSTARADRRITRHPIAIFTGCNEQALALIGHGITNAISVGAPLYNQGNIAACYHVYEGAAQDIDPNARSRPGAHVPPSSSTPTRKPGPCATRSTACSTSSSESSATRSLPSSERERGA